MIHVHREGSDRARGGGLAVIHQDNINDQPRSHNIPHSSFERQIVNIIPKSKNIVPVNIYRFPPSSKSFFFEESSILLATLGIYVVYLLVICGDFNLPGKTPDNHDNELARLQAPLHILHTTGQLTHQIWHTSQQILLVWSHHYIITFNQSFLNRGWGLSWNFWPLPGSRQAQHILP